MRTPVLVALAAAIVACAPTPRPTSGPVPAVPLLPHAILPLPASIRLSARDTLIVTDSTPVTYTDDASGETRRIATYLTTLIGPAALNRVPQAVAATAVIPSGAIHLRLDPQATSFGEEGYALTVSRERAELVARDAAGLFYAVQTLRQLLPVSIEHPSAVNRKLRVVGGSIVDAPRFAWRGMMLDVARHFLPSADVKRFIDAMALYKMNRLHLHLSDDQGWRIDILSWPNLTRHGGSTEVGGGPSGYYTQADYRDLVAYARDRFITIVPEIDMPGHINAALASYPSLNCDGTAPPLYTGIRVGFSLLCTTSDTAYRFVDDVVRELSALTPGAYFHIGGDEVEKLGHVPYLRFVERAEGIVRSHGKRAIGWGEIAPANLHPSTIVQHWRTDATASRDSAFLHAARGGSVIMSPGNRTYLDMKYDSTSVLGLRWAGLISVRHTYEWEPGTFLPGVPERAVLGVEAPLWSETFEKREDYEFNAFPRLLSIAEVGWTPGGARRWENFRERLGAHGPRLQALGINFARVPEVSWR